MNNNEKTEKIHEPSVEPFHEKEKIESFPEEDYENRIKVLEESLAEAQDRYVRAFAEMENIRRRALKEKEEAIKFGSSALAKDIIAFVDNLERALQCFPKIEENNEKEMDSFLKGLNIITKDILEALEKHGICKIKSDGQDFDPTFHQAVAEVPAQDGKKGIISQTLQTGYTINDRLLRAAMVVVTK